MRWQTYPWPPLPTIAGSANRGNLPLPNRWFLDVQYSERIGLRDVPAQVHTSYFNKFE